MKKNRQNKFYMADSDNYDEFNSVVPEEEYDPEEGEYDEDNQQQYADDEAYDEEQYDEEQYDESVDGYDDQYYDDRLTKVLDELAYLKRGMSPAVQQTQSSGDVVMYNEISRLREELNKTQSTQNLHSELSRLKEEMDRDKKMNEMSFLSEIKRLNKKIEGLSKSQTNVQAIPNKRNNQFLDSASCDGVSGADFSKLVSINESILLSTRETDAKFHNELSSLKTKMETMPNFDELNRLIVSIKNSIKNLDLRTSASIGENLTDEINALTASINSANFTAATESGKKLIARLNMVTNSIPYNEDGGACDSFITRAICELKGLVGSANPEDRDAINTNLAAYEEIDKLNAIMDSQIPYKGKLLELNSFFKKNSKNKNYNQDVINSIKNIVNNVLSEPLNRENFDELLAFSRETNAIAINLTLKDGINRYLDLYERILCEDGKDLLPLLPKLISVTKGILTATSDFDYAAIENQIKNKAMELDDADEFTATSIYNAITELFDEFGCIKISDVVTYAPIYPQARASSAYFVEGDALFDKISDLKILINDLSLAVFSNATPEAPQEVLAEINSLKAKINDLIEHSNSNNKNLLSGLDEIKEQVHLNELEESLSSVTASEDEKQTLIKEIHELRERFASSANNIQSLLADVIDIKAKLVEDAKLENFSKIGDDLTFIRSQIESNMETSDSSVESVASEDIASLMENISTIKEKLSILDEYDTVAEILSLREDIKASRIVDSNDVSSELEGLRTAVAELRAELQDLKAINNEISHTNTFVKTDSIIEGAVTSNEINMLLSEIVSLRDEIQSYKDDVNNIIATERGDIAIKRLPKDDENITIILDELTGLRSELIGCRQENDTVDITEIKESIAEIKNLISRRTTIAETDIASEASNELNVVLDQIVDLKNEVDILKQQLALSADTKDEIGAIKKLLLDSCNIDAIKEENAKQMQAFKDDLVNIFSSKMQEFMDNSSSIKVQDINTTAAMPADYSIITTELAEIKYQLNSNSLAALTQDDGTILNEILALHDELSSLANYFGDIKKSQDIEESIEIIRSDVSSIKNEPDLSIIKEVLALREEFQAFKDELNKTHTEPEKANSELLTEIQSLRDQIFAISMANINDGTTSADVYESYNNIILDEISSIKEELGQLKEENSIKNLSDELSEIKSKLSNMAVDEQENFESKFKKLSSEIAELKMQLDELSEKESSYISPKMLQEIDKLKAEIAATAESKIDKSTAK